VHNRAVVLPGAFSSPFCRAAMARIGLAVARIFLDVPKTHPQPGTFDWSLPDRQIREAIASGMAPMLCLHQRGPGWFLGDKEKPWWRHDAARKEWAAFAKACAERYRGKAPYYEILNEPQHLHKDSPTFMGWECSVAMFIEAASGIKQADPNALCGGAATWAAWESAEWAKRVLAKPDGERLLDFVSYHIYTSHHLEDTDDKIMAKTPWFGEAPVHIRAELSKASDKRILVAITEFNTSAVWSKDGKLCTDPRNRDGFGGVVAALALLYSARGGCDVAVHFGIMGGFGLIRWPPRYEILPVYHAVHMVRQIAGLQPEAKLLATVTDEEPKKVKNCIRGDALTHDLEPFAIRSPDALAVVLINKKPRTSFAAVLDCPFAPSTHAKVYRYASIRLGDALFPLETLQARKGPLPVVCPPYSVTVVRWDR